MSCQFWLLCEPDCSSGFCNISYYFLYVNYIDFNTQLSILVAPLWYTIYWPPGLLYKCVWWQFFSLNLCTETWVSFYVFVHRNFSWTACVFQVGIVVYVLGGINSSCVFWIGMRILPIFWFGSLFLLYSMSLLFTGFFFFFCMRISSWHCCTLVGRRGNMFRAVLPLHAYFKLALWYLGR